MGSGFGYEEVVFDSDAADAGEIDTRLDGDDVAGMEGHGGVHGVEAGVFVAVEAHAVAQAVAEVLAVAVLGDVTAGDGVDFVGGFAGGEGRGGVEVGVEDDLVDLGDLGGPFVEREGAGHVAVVALVDGAPVDEDGFVGGDLVVGGAVVGEGAVGFGGDDGLETGLAAAAGLHFGFDAGGDLEFGLAGLDRGEDGDQGILLDLDGLLDEGDFAGILLGAELGDDAGGGNQELGTEVAGEGVGLGDVEVFSLEGAASGAAGAEDFEDGLGHALAADEDVDDGGDGLELLLVPEVADDDGARLADQEVAVAAEEAGQVCDILGVGDQEGVGVGGGDELEEAVKAAGVRG